MLMINKDIVANRTVCFLAFIMAICVLALSQNVRANGAYEVATTSGQIIPHEVTDIFYDTSDKKALSEIISIYEKGGFKKTTGKDFSAKYTKDAIWLSIYIKNGSSKNIQRYIEIGAPRLQEVSLYFQDKNKKWREMKSGSKLPDYQRVVDSRLLAIPLDLTAYEHKHVYIRIKSDNAIAISLRAWLPRDFHKSERKIDAINGMQFGALFIFVFYSVLLFFSTKEVNFLYFGVLVASCILNDVALFQYGNEYFWPGSVNWNLRSPGILGTPILIGGVLLFVRILQLKGKYPKITRGLYMAMGVTVAIIPAMLWLDYGFWVLVQQLLGLVLLAFLASFTFYSLWVGVSDASLILAAFFTTWIVTIIRLAQVVGLIPLEFAMDYSQNWALVLSGVLMIALLRAKVKKIEDEKIKLRQEGKNAILRAQLKAEQEVFLRTQKLWNAKEVAEAANRSKSVFITRLSHELRTPLHSVLGYSELILAEEPEKILRRRVESIRQSGQHLLGLIDELLDYARGEAGRLKLELKAQCLSQLLIEVVDAQRLLAQEEKIDFVLIMDPAVHSTVNVDGVRLRQIISNLVVNAFRHSQGSRVVLRVQAEIKGDQLVASFMVCDNGVGIKADQRERVFHPFEQGESAVDGVRRYSLGLGLAISRQLVELMGGELTLESPVSGGMPDAPLSPAPSPARGEGRTDIPSASAHFSQQGESVDTSSALAESTWKAEVNAAASTRGEGRTDIPSASAHFSQQGESVDTSSTLAESTWKAEVNAAASTRGEGRTDTPSASAHFSQQGESVDTSSTLAESIWRAGVNASASTRGEGWGEGGRLPDSAPKFAPQNGSQFSFQLSFGLVQADSAVAEQVITHTAIAPAYTGARPSQESLVHLAQLLAEGDILAMEEWVEETLQREPDAVAFAKYVSDCLQKLEFGAICRLIEAGSVSSLSHN